jgi:transcriptional antiterminator RfaH
VSRLVTFGNTPAKVDDELIHELRMQESAAQIEPERLFKSGERVRITTYPFADIEGIYQMVDADQRVMVLIEMMSKPVKIIVSPCALKKVG